jgi:hypothetical protein
MAKRKKTETRVPNHWDLLFPGRFLKACDLKGRPATITIRRLYQEKIDGKWKLIVWFPEGKEKNELSLNRTNGEAIAAMFGRKKPQEWVGRRITIKEETVSSFGDRVPAIRIIGSPDIDRPVEVDVDLGRVNIRRTLRPTGNGSRRQQRPPAPELEIGPGADGDPGHDVLTDQEQHDGWELDENGEAIPPEDTGGPHG